MMTHKFSCKMIEQSSKCGGCRVGGVDSKAGLGVALQDSMQLA